MIDFTYIKFGVILALAGILFGGLMGLSFGCCEDSVKGMLKDNSTAVLAEKYKGDENQAAKVTEKAWVYFKRAHLHSQTMGVISLVFSLVVAFLKFPKLFQMGISILSGLGALGYGVFWLLAGYLAPGMGSTGAAKEAVGLIAQLSGGSFFIAGVSLFALLVRKMFLQKQPS